MEGEELTSKSNDTSRLKEYIEDAWNKQDELEWLSIKYALSGMQKEPEILICGECGVEFPFGTQHICMN